MAVKHGLPFGFALYRTAAAFSFRCKRSYGGGKSQRDFGALEWGEGGRGKERGALGAGPGEGGLNNRAQSNSKMRNMTMARELCQRLSGD